MSQHVFMGKTDVNTRALLSGLWENTKNKLSKLTIEISELTDSFAHRFKEVRITTPNENVTQCTHLSSFSESPPYTIFLLSGISVDDVSTPTHIILKNVSLLTSGRYKCEVSGGPPRWEIRYWESYESCYLCYLFLFKDSRQTRAWRSYKLLVRNHFLGIIWQLVSRYLN